ncbi:hypothetical protein CCO03_17075 [Comamonas serinivorans]|uniref:Helix-turn-helix domain-containing protein n=1 Tax=Comamonas serinivorans TaxID=1082851 RepID=A0A1Y0ES72_9BURK|nr:helix-turn-helix domain-containing protein [Comamonas serinivorans]ARU06159.1 hypothetical protein CCO03_17075 [Comamonas serinivorans]
MSSSTETETPRYAVIPAVALLDKRLSPRDLTVLCSLGMHTDKQGWCMPSQGRIGAMLGITRQAVSKSIMHLRECGYVMVSARRGADGGQTSNLMRVVMDTNTPADSLREVPNHSTAPRNPTLHPPQPHVAPPATSEVAPPATSEIAPPATSEVARNPPLKSPTEIPKGRTQARADTPTCPDGVTEQTWADWLQLRKTKKAVVTATVLDSARREAEKAGMSLDAFLREWCLRGSQGLKADWLLADRQRSSSATTGETAYQRSMRERMQEVAPSIARKAPGVSPQQASEFFEVEARRVDETRRIGGAA